MLMKTAAIIVATAALAGAAVVWPAAGDIIRSFTLASQPADAVRGLAKDWSDGNIWAAGVQTENDIRFAKFNATTTALVTGWTQFQGAVWQYDLGYGYMSGGNRYFVAVDSYFPRLRVYDTTGSLVGTMPDPYTVPLDVGIDCDWGGTLVFFTNYNYNVIQRWNGSGWATWATVPYPTMGVATGWGRVFAVSGWGDFKIYEYYLNSGMFSRSIPLNGWPPNGTLVGMSIGRVNALGSEESVFIAVYEPADLIYEVSIGDVTGTTLAPSSLGKIKTLYR